VRSDAVVSDETHTPNLDKPRTEGIELRSAIAPGPKTPESLPAIWTGSYPTDIDSDDDYNDWQGYWQARIKRHLEAHDTLPEQFQRAGYETGAVTTNTWTTRPFGFDQGFSRFHDALSEQSIGAVDMDRILQHIPYGNDVYRLLFRKKSLQPWESYYDEVLATVEGFSESYFCWMFLMDTHFPYLPPREFRSLSTWRMYATIYRFRRSNWGKDGVDEQTRDDLRTLYHDTIEYVDSFVGEFIDDTSESDPVIIFIGDHGEALGEHGYYYHRYHLYPENIHVPLFIGNVGEPKTIEDPISLRQLPAICRILRQAPPDVGDSLAQLAGEAWSRSQEGNSLAVWTSDERTALERDGHTGNITQNIKSIYRILSHEEETNTIQSVVEEGF